MSQEEVLNIFKPFGKSAKDQPPGVVSHHIGLSITKSLVEALGGTISVTSQLGIGSKFKFTIRVTRATEKPNLEKKLRRSKPKLIKSDLNCIDEIEEDVVTDENKSRQKSSNEEFVIVDSDTESIRVAFPES